MPKCLPPIGGSHFGDPSGSRVTPSAPKATSPGMQSHPLGAPWVLWVLLLLSLSLFFFFRVFFFVVPVGVAIVVFLLSLL